MPLKAARFDVAISGASFAGLALACALSDALGAELQDRAHRPRRPTSRRGPTRAPSRCPQPRTPARGDRRLGRRLPSTPAGHRYRDYRTRASKPACGPCCSAYDNSTRGRGAGHLHRPRRPADGSAARQSRQLAFDHAAGAGRGGRASRPERRASACASPTGVRSRLRSSSPPTGASRLCARLPASRSSAGATRRRASSRPSATTARTMARAVQHFLPAGPFAILPLTGNRACITWTEDAREATRILALDDAGLPRRGRKALRRQARRHRARWPAPILAAGAASCPPLCGAAVRAARRCRARRASAGGAGVEPRVSRCRRAGRGRRRERAHRLRRRRRSGAHSLRAVAPFRFGHLGGDVRRHQPAVCQPTPPCCARRARSASASWTAFRP